MKHHHSEGDSGISDPEKKKYTVYSVLLPEYSFPPSLSVISPTLHVNGDSG